MQIDIKFKKLYPDAKVPVYATDGSGAFDLCCYIEKNPFIDYKTLYKGQSIVLGTGLAFEIPKDHVMLIFSRSGHGFTHDVRLGNCVGVIDSDYRGEVKIKLRNDREYTVCYAEEQKLDFRHGDRIAQGIILPLPKVGFVEVDTLSETERGDGGFGHTGSGAIGETNNER